MSEWRTALVLLFYTVGEYFAVKFQNHWFVTPWHGQQQFFLTCPRFSNKRAEAV
jgi:hypothetical protein